MIYIFIFGKLKLIVGSNSTTCTDGNVRLVNGTTSNEGRVEYCDGGSWTAIDTRYSFSPRTAYLICRQLGFVANSCKTQN